MTVSSLSGLIAWGLTREDALVVDNLDSPDGSLVALENMLRAPLSDVGFMLDLLSERCGTFVMLSGAVFEHPRGAVPRSRGEQRFERARRLFLGAVMLFGERRKPNIQLTDVVMMVIQNLQRLVATVLCIDGDQRVETTDNDLSRSMSRLGKVSTRVQVARGSGKAGLFAKGSRRRRASQEAGGEIAACSDQQLFIFVFGTSVQRRWCFPLVSSKAFYLRDGGFTDPAV